MSRSEALFDRILAGELDPDSPEVVEAAAHDPRLRERLDELRETETALERSGRDLRARAARPVAGEEEALAAFRATLRASPPPRFPRAILITIASLAAVLVVWLVARDGAREPVVAPPPRTLGDDASCLEPRGGVRAYSPFAWNLELPENGSFELTIRAVDGSVLLRKTDLARGSIELDRAESEALPARILWSVVVLDGSGTPSGVACASEAWLDPSAPR